MRRGEVNRSREGESSWSSLSEGGSEGERCSEEEEEEERGGGCVRSASRSACNNSASSPFRSANMKKMSAVFRTQMLSCRRRVRGEGADEEERVE